jgi:Rieske Fe-S protein
MACEKCVNRRDFLAKSALAAAAMVVADGCGDGQIGAPVRSVAAGGDPSIPISPSVTVKLADIPGLATVGTLVAIGNERAAVRTGTASFRGLSMICTHEQCDTEVRNNRFECPCHGSVFAADGSVIHGPIGASGSVTALRQLSVTFDQAAGTITVA